jgi:tripartite-type tricarboxylate transporter receptor subunit TctC
MNAIFKMPDVIQKLQAQGFELGGGTPEEFAALIKADQDRWSPLIKKLGLKID